MKSRNHLCLKASLGALALLVFAAPAVRAQTPALTISLASTSELLGDIQHITNVAGAGDAGGFAVFMAQAYTQHLDPAKPAGVVVNFNGQEPVATGFLPVKNLPALLQMLEQQVGKPEDLGNGVQKITLDQPLFIKQDGEWVYVSNSEAGVGGLANPGGLIADLVKSHDIAIRANLRAVPEGLRQFALQQMQTGFQRQMDAQANPGQTPEEVEAQRKVAEQAMAQAMRMINELEEIVVGLSIDRENKNVHIDFSITAAEGTELAKQMAAYDQLTSRFGGFRQPGAAAMAHFASVIPADQVGQTLALLSTMEEQAAKEIDKDNSLQTDEAKAAVKKVLGSFMNVAKKTIESGKTDGGMVLMLNDGVAFAAGGHVADGAALATAFKELVDLAKNEPDFPDVKFDAAQHAGVTFHTMSMPIPEGQEDARAALGESIEVVLGTGADSAYIGFGTGAQDLIKKVIDDSAAAGNVKVQPLELVLTLGPILKFATKMDPDNTQLAAAAAAVDAAQGRDQVNITVKTIPRGAAYQLKVDEGVIDLIGKAMSDQDDEDDGF